jgi:transposase, IS30 family
VEKPTKYRRLGLEEREEISRGLASGKSLNQIAREILRSRSTLSREVNRSRKSTRYTYRAFRAHRRAKRASGRRRGGQYRLSKNPRLWAVIESLLRKKWSPQQIVMRLPREYPLDKSMRISHEAIYSYLYVFAKGSLKEELVACLRRNHKHRHKKGLRRAIPQGVPDMTLIDERPRIVEERLIPGHWEGDLIYGKNCRSMLGTLVERKTRFLMLVPLKTKKSDEVREAFARKMKRLPRQLRQTLTYDQGTEMTQHRLFTQETQIKVYFAHPQSPWERGTNENTNGLIRQFFPTNTDFTQVSPQEIKEVEHLLNDRPRKVLDWDKPCEAFAKVLR